ncbi:MAG: hypothetical protein JRI45_09110 [Deltaproteobacteria bacterium]|nr:hypothetical protein [Deltaproteobacteria bacterium]
MINLKPDVRYKFVYKLPGNKTVHARGPVFQAEALKEIGKISESIQNAVEPT